MKKTISVVIAVLLICMTVGAFIACGGEENKGKSVEQVTSTFEDAGYKVASQTVSGISALVAIKGTDTLTVLFYDNTKQATESKSTWDTAAKAVGYTCKQDNNNIYYGSAAAIAIYDGI